MSRLDDLAANVTVVILGGGQGSRLDPLTRLRSKPAVPVAGKYRLIDIPISNAINSQLERMYVLTQFNSVSLHRHIGRTYRFDAFSRGYVHILAAQQTPSGQAWFQGTADAVRQNLPAFCELPDEHVLILAGDHMYRMDYRELMQDHQENDADITVGVLPCSEKDIAGFGAARLDESGRIVEFREKPGDPEARAGMEAPRVLLARHGVGPERPYLASMGIYMFRKEVLVQVLAGDLVDFGRDIIPAAIERFRVQAHFFTGYWRDIGTIRAFFDAHMDLVSSDPPFTFHDPGWPFYTRPRYLPGARLTNCHFNNVILADGTHVDGCAVEDSVIGLRTPMRGARVRRALIMGVDSHYPDAPATAPPIGIGPGTEIHNAIVDKNPRIGRNVRIVNARNQREADGDGWAIRDGVVVVAKNSIIQDGTVI